MIFLLDEQDFPGDYKHSVFYFYASWMPFHKKMLVVLNKLEKKYKFLNFYAIDVDNLRKLCKRFSVENLPTVLIMLNGKEKRRITELVSTATINKIFADIYLLATVKHGVK